MASACPVCDPYNSRNPALAMAASLICEGTRKETRNPKRWWFLCTNRKFPIEPAQ